MRATPSKKSGKPALGVNTGSAPKIAPAFIGTLQKPPAVKLRRILAATDFSELSLAAVRYAVALTRQFSARLSLMTAVEPSVYLSGFEHIVIGDSDDAIVEGEKTHLARLARKLSKPGKPISEVVRYGKAFREIVAVAGEQESDLVVLATHGRTGLKRALIGSTAEWVVRHAPCPVLTIPSKYIEQHKGDRPGISLRRILVPIDFSETSLKALSYALELARGFGGEVTLVHVIEPRPALTYPSSAELDGQMREAAEELLLRVRREAFDQAVPTRSVIRLGTPHQEIVGTAGRLGADLIILTTHGHTGFDRALLGSTAERTVRHAGCPVLVVRDKAKA